ncbi:STAS domain-containing protein [Streptomyces sp. A0592]|uniref:STAS domain-containing protein n=1 Tax=Streptomyces sp. A0592 TaxID=2563099 RepID=UPI00109E621E|nr:STAS domain-containing protein [Streptomyces sp. A0592]THA81229.1 anti-sigma factor antagonist [Streptomyces sp. A0592]
MQMPKVTVRSGAGAVREVVCSGEFDADSVGRLDEVCAREAGDARVLVLDVSQVAFADSSFLNVLIRANNSGPLVLADPLPRQLRRMLEMTGALPLFDLRDDDAPTG